MNTKIQELVIEGITYVPKGSETIQSTTVDGMTLVLIRGYASGVQFGYLKERNGCEVTLINSRRIYNWNNATETTQIAAEGVNEKTSKVTMQITEQIITDVIQCINIEQKAAKSLLNCPIWKI